MLQKRLVRISSCLVFLLSVIFFTSCTTTTGTKSSLNQNTLSKINKIGITVKSENDFSVRLSRDKMANVGTAILGLVGTAIEAGVRTGTDQKLEKELKSKINNFDLEKHMNEKLRSYLRSAKVFRAVESVNVEDHSELKGKNFDAILNIAIKEWGLRLCVGADKKKQLQVGIDIHGEVLFLKGGNTLWERNELYLDGECYSLEEIKSHDGIIENILDRAVDNLSGKIINEIRFP